MGKKKRKLVCFEHSIWPSSSLQWSLGAHSFERWHVRLGWRNALAMLGMLCE